jgi:hypothetical protein
VRFNVFSGRVLPAIFGPVPGTALSLFFIPYVTHPYIKQILVCVRRSFTHALGAGDNLQIVLFLNIGNAATEYAFYRDLIH